MKIIAKNLNSSDQLRSFSDGSIRKTVKLGTAMIGLGTYQPGWQWSFHVGAQTGKSSENHIGHIISGHMMIQDSEGVEVEVGPGDSFEVMPGHDAWVLGDETCIALDFNNITH